MTKVFVTKRGGVLIAADDETRAVLDRIKDGTDLSVEIKRARNLRFHRLLIKLLDMIVDNTDQFDSIEQALLAIKIGTHEVDTYVDASTGKVYFIPRSIAFENMDEDAFVRFFNRATFVACERWLKGMKFEELRDELYRMIDGPERSSLGRRATAGRSA